MKSSLSPLLSWPPCRRAAPRPGPRASPTRPVACFGFCPIYRVTVSADGSGVFEGVRFTAVSRRARASGSSAAQYRAFAAQLAPLRPAAARSATIMRRAAGPMATDMPSATSPGSGRPGAPHRLNYLLWLRHAADDGGALRTAPALLPIAAWIVSAADQGFHRARAATTSSPMTTSIGEMSDRARDVFRMVVEAYLESGQPVGSRTISRTSSAQPLAGLDPQRHAGSGGIRPARRAAHLRGADSDRDRACACSSTAIMQVAEPRPEDRAAIEALIDRGGPIEEAIAQRHRRAFRPLRLRRHRARAEGGAGAEAARLRAACRRRRRWRWWSAATAASRTGWSICRRASPPSTLVEVGNYVSARLSGLTLREAQARLGRGDRRRQGGARQGRAALWSRAGSRSGRRTARAGRC